MPEIRTETMTINMGPQHPSTHGVFRLVLEIDGEVVVSAKPTIGYLHTGIEKTAEQKKWQQVIPLMERMDYLGAQSNSLSYCLSVERLLGLEMPDRVKWIRVLLAELQRINSHLVWLGTHAMDLGAVSVMLYCFRERELLLNINELIAGFRMFPSYIRVGGLREDLPRGFHEAVRALLERLPGEDRRVRRPADEELDLREPHAGRRLTSASSSATQYGLVGPIARAAGSTYDVRKAFPYCGYETFEFDVPDAARTATSTTGISCASREMRESVQDLPARRSTRITPTGEYQVNDPRVVPPPKDKVYTEMEALIQHFLIYSQGFTVPAGEATCRSRARAASTASTSCRTAPTVRCACTSGRRRCWRARRWSRWSSAGSSPTSSPSSARPTSSWETWTGEFPSADAVRATGFQQVRAEAAARRASRSRSRRSSREKFEELRGALSARAAQVGDPATRCSSCRSSRATSRRNAMRHVAEVIGCTPAEVEDVATYYAMFYTQPVGKYVMQVCRTLSCALNGAERVTEEIGDDARHPAGGTDATRHVHGARGRVPRRVRPRAGRHGERRAGTSA